MGAGRARSRPPAGRAAIIGAGFGGLAAAIRLAAGGYKVKVYEQNSYPGGKAGFFEEGGYRFDSGPSLVTMHHVFEDLFDAAGKKMDSYLTFVPLDPICTYYFDDGLRLEARKDPYNFADEVGAATGENPAHVLEYLEHSRRIYRRTAPLFLERSLHRPSNLFKAPVLGSIFRRGKLDIFKTMDQANREYFKDPRIIQLFDRYATYNGSNPYRVPGTLNIIPHVEYNMGSYAIEGGIYKIPRALYRVAKALGVEFSFDNKVEKIQRKEKPGADITGILSGEGYEETDIIEELRCPDDPTVYINITSKVTSSDVPGEGGENWFVLVNAPRNAGQDWVEETKKARAAVSARIAKALGKTERQIEEDIAVERTLTPERIEAETGSTYGSLYGISSNTRTAAFLRHPAQTTRYPQLFFVGGSVHPGGGMPLALLSGKIASEEIFRLYGYPLHRSATSTNAKGKQN